MVYIFNQCNHLFQRLIGQMEHFMDMLILPLGKVFAAPALTVDGTGQIVAAVTDAFDLRYFPEHSPDL